MFSNKPGLVVGPFLLKRRDNGIDSAIKELHKEFPSLKLCEGKLDGFSAASPTSPLSSARSTPSSARSNATSDLNESLSSQSPRPTRIARMGSEQQATATPDNPEVGTALIRSKSADTSRLVKIKEIPPELSLYHIERGDTKAVLTFIEKGGNPNEVYILNRPLMHFLLINAANNAELPKAIDFFNALLPYADLSLPDKKGRKIFDLLEENQESKLKILLHAKESLALLYARKIEALTIEIENRLNQIELKIKSVKVKLPKLKISDIPSPTSLKETIEAISKIIQKISRKELAEYFSGLIVSFDSTEIVSQIHKAWQDFDIIQKMLGIWLVAKLLVTDMQNDLVAIENFEERLHEFNKECVATFPEHGEFFAEEFIEIIKLKSQFKFNMGLKNYWYLTDNFSLAATASLPSIQEIIAKCTTSEAALQHAAGMLAHDLNALFLSIYKCIRFSEFRDKAWSKSNKKQAAPYLSAFPNIVEKLNQFFLNIIYSAEPQQVSNYLKLIILTIEALLRPKNGFPPNLYMANQLLATLEQSAVSRLHGFFEMLPPRFQGVLSELQKFTTDRSFHWIRLFLKADPTAPLHINIMLRDLSVGDDGNNGLPSISVCGKIMDDFIDRQKHHMHLTCQFNTDLAHQIIQAPQIDHEAKSNYLSGVFVVLEGSFKDICELINRELDQHFYPRFQISENGRLTVYPITVIEEGIFDLFVKKLSGDGIEEADFNTAKQLLGKLDRLTPKEPVDGNPVFLLMKRLTEINELKKKWLENNKAPLPASPITPGRP